ncbi:hypothetical protein C0995_003579 [Termitomyces sp. Mi166|nr:hypothetical protein C0995_003579 [Termitomyces sp. Mi166\
MFSTTFWIRMCVEILSNFCDDFNRLFFVDDGAIVPVFEQDDDVEVRDSDTESSSSSTSRPRSPPKPLPKSRKPPAWIDPSDPPTISLDAPWLRKLRDALTEETLSAREYEARLRRQYERINPEPAWSAKARKEKKEESGGDGAGIADLLSSTSGILGRRNKAHLKAGQVELERLRDANLSVGSADRRVRLFNALVPSSTLTTRHARGLWGTTFNTVNDVSFLRKRRRKGTGEDPGLGSGGVGGEDGSHGIQSGDGRDARGGWA